MQLLLFFSLLSYSLGAQAEFILQNIQLAENRGLRHSCVSLLNTLRERTIGSAINLALPNVDEVHHAFSISENSATWVALLKNIHGASQAVNQFRNYAYQLSHHNQIILAQILSRVGNNESFATMRMLGHLYEIIQSNNENLIARELFLIRQAIFERSTQLALAIEDKLASNPNGINLDLYHNANSIIGARLISYNRQSALARIHFFGRYYDLPLGDLYEIMTERTVLENQLPLIEQWSTGHPLARPREMRWEILSTTNNNFIQVRPSDNLNFTNLRRHYQSMGSALSRSEFQGRYQHDLRALTDRFGLLRHLGFAYNSNENILILPNPHRLSYAMEEFNHPLLSGIRFESVFFRNELDPLLFAQFRAHGIRPVGVGGWKSHDYHYHVINSLMTPKKINDIIEAKYRTLVALINDPQLKHHQNTKRNAWEQLEALMDLEESYSIIDFLWNDTLPVRDRMRSLNLTRIENMANESARDVLEYFETQTMTQMQRASFNRIMQEASSESLNRQQIIFELTNPAFRDFLLL